tara:strand:- start:16 stop:1251 length:1236 start_codon:yes stop_codon:yes gene_type:complete
MNVYLVIIVAALLLEFILQTMSRLLDLNRFSTDLPGEFNSYYSPEEYMRSQKYFRSNAHFSLFTSTFDLLVVLLVIFLGLFNTLDLWVREFDFSSIVSGLMFFGVIVFIQDVIGTPASIYRTFVIEENFGFNNTTLKTYTLDKIKQFILFVLLGGLILYLLLYFFETYGDRSWLYAWISISSVLILFQPLFTLIIAPLFNTFTPMEDGKLKQRIAQYAEKTNFPISRIDVMDGSRRSSKGNAYFSGWGKNKRIAIFDTLIAKHSIDELLSIVAHEVGHYKMKHNTKAIIFSVIQLGIMFFLLSLFLNNPKLFSAFSVDNLSIYASLLFFTLLYSPIQLIMSFWGNRLSRKHEFEADAFAFASIGTSKHLIKGLKKLTVTGLGNLNPHPFTVWLNYSHPPILERIQALRNTH